MIGDLISLRNVVIKDYKHAFPYVTSVRNISIECYVCLVLEKEYESELNGTSRG